MSIAVSADRNPSSSMGLGDTTSIAVRIIMDSKLYQVLDGQETTPTIAMPSLL